ncbi:hypothetical protein [Streptomyces sp. OE57]|uniref:hypothetical protein n=1 Tax=Streptomyces lacaronensis TaxID=3379885 RepID=UPI0039B7594C
MTTESQRVPPDRDTHGQRALALLRLSLDAAQANPRREEPMVELVIVLTEAASLAAEAFVRLGDCRTEYAPAQDSCVTCALRDAVNHIRAAATTARFALVSSMGREREGGHSTCSGEKSCTRDKESHI